MIKELKANRVNNIIDDYLSNMIYENTGIQPPYIDFYYHIKYVDHYSLLVNNKNKRITIITNHLIETYYTYKNCTISEYINNKMETDDYEVNFIEQFIYGKEFW